MTYLAHLSLDDYALQTSGKIYLNDYSHLEDLSDLKDQLYERYKDEISMIPQCTHGCTKGAWDLGNFCSTCGTEVVDRFSDLRPKLWIKNFDKGLKFVDPHFWGQLNQLFRSNRGKKIDAIRYLADTSYIVHNPNPILVNLASLIGGRGYRNLINNIEKILIYLLNNSTFRAKGKTNEVNNLIKIFKEQKGEIFCSNLPVINSRLFVMEETDKGSFTSSSLPALLDLALYAVKLSKEHGRRLENGYAYMISSINILFDGYMNDFVSGKGGLARKNIYGTRLAFTTRGVVVSKPITDNHETITVPWITGLTVFRPHVLNRLKKRGYRYKEASQLLYDSINCYSKVIDDILQELLEESKTKPDGTKRPGIPVMMHRFPSLMQGSAQFLYIDGFKSDEISNKTISLPYGVVKAFNADLRYIGPLYSNV